MRHPTGQLVHRIDPPQDWESTRFHVMLRTPTGSVAAFALASWSEVQEILQLSKLWGWTVQALSPPEPPTNPPHRRCINHRDELDDGSESVASEMGFALNAD